MLLLVLSTQGVDIADVEVVIVYGLPKTAAQLYQVLCLGHCVTEIIISVVWSVQAEMDVHLEVICCIVLVKREAAKK